MTTYIIRRLLYMFPAVLLVSVMVFSFLHLAGGDPAVMMLGEGADPQLIAMVRSDLGLDKPLHEQYLTWLSKAARGDLGRSILPNRAQVGPLILQRGAVTLELGVLAMMLSIVVGLPLGILAGVRRGRLTDLLATNIATFGITIPNFLLALILMLIFSLWLRWLPPSGYVSPTVDLGKNLQLMILPVVTLATFLAASVVRVTRASIVEIMDRQFIYAARAKGLNEPYVVIRHALKAALIPIVTISGLQLGTVLGGSIIIESVFALPGLGKLTIDAVYSRDFPVLQGAVLVLSIGFVVTNLVVDLVYAYLDPRISYG